MKLGGPSGLHEKVPAVMFNLFGGGGLSEYTWYSIGALFLTPGRRHRGIAGQHDDRGLGERRVCRAALGR